MYLASWNLSEAQTSPIFKIRNREIFNVLEYTIAAIYRWKTTQECTNILWLQDYQLQEQWLLLHWRARMRKERGIKVSDRHKK